MLYLNPIFFWLNTGKNADPYIIKPPSLLTTRECDVEADGALFSWFGRILFLPHQSNFMAHFWLFAINHICKNKKPYLYMHKKARTKLLRPSNPSLGRWKSTCFIFVFYPLSFSRQRYPNTAVAVKGYYKYRFLNLYQSLWSPKVIGILIIMKIISFTLKQSGWLESKQKSKNYNWRL